MSTPINEYISFIKNNFPDIKKIGIIYHNGDKEPVPHKAVMHMVEFRSAKNPYEFIDGLNTLGTEVDAILLLPERELITSRSRAPPSRSARNRPIGLRDRPVPPTAIVDPDGMSLRTDGSTITVMTSPIPNGLRSGSERC